MDAQIKIGFEQGLGVTNFHSPTNFLPIGKWGIRVFLVLFISLSLIPDIAANPKSKIDSLEKIIHSSEDNDSLKVKAMVDLAWLLKYDSAAVAQNLLEDALILTKSLGYKALTGKTYNQLGVVHSIHGDYIGSINFYIKAIEIFEELGDAKAQAMINNNIGMLYHEEHSHKKAIDHFYKSLEINEQNNDLLQIQLNCLNLSDSYRYLEEIDSAMKYVEYGLEVNKKKPDEAMLASFLMNKGMILDLQGKTHQALELFEKAYNLDRKLGLKEGMSVDLINIAYSKMEIGRYDAAEKDLKLSETYALEIDYKEHLAEVYMAFIELYSKQNKYKAAFEYENKYIQLHDSILDANMKDAVQQIEQRHKLAKAEAEFRELKRRSELREQQHLLDIERHKVEVEHHKMVNYIIFFVLLLLVVITIAILRNNIRRKKTNAILAQKNSEIENKNQELEHKNVEIETQKAIIEQKNMDVMDSIEYAKKIQFSILPENKLFDYVFTDYFIFYKPKDIVSGDFYWATIQDGKIYFAVVDCTGHGVPGAFMSILAYNGLNKIVSDNPGIKPGQILDRLHYLIRDMQHLEEGSSVKEGMDLALCSFDPGTSMLEYAGALNPLLVMMNNEIIELDANRRSIASTLQNSKSYFRNYVVKLDKGDSFYMYTDGFIDQFGGPRGKKITKRRLIDVLEGYAAEGKTMNEQGESLEGFFEDWKVKENQIDDVCVIGIRV